MSYFLNFLFADVEAYVVMMGEVPVFPVSDLANVLVPFCASTWAFMAVCSCVTSFSIYCIFKTAFFVWDRLRVLKKGVNDNG